MLKTWEKNIFKLEINVYKILKEYFKYSNMEKKNLYFALLSKKYP